jgi:hypothetical protein
MSPEDRAHARALLIIALAVAGVILLAVAGTIAIVAGAIAAVTLR